MVQSIGPYISIEFHTSIFYGCLDFLNSIFRSNLKVPGAAPLAMNKSHSMMSKRGMDRQTSSRIVSELLSQALSAARLQSVGDEQGVLEAINNEGLFEAATLANPQLPQYHPKLLIEMLNSGKTRRAKAILLHVLRTLRAHTTTADSRTLKVRKMSISDGGSDAYSLDSAAARRNSFGRRDSFIGGSFQRIGGVMEQERLEYEELESIIPLPLHAIFSADRSEPVRSAPKVFLIDI